MCCISSPSHSGQRWQVEGDTYRARCDAYNIILLYFCLYNCHPVGDEPVLIHPSVNTPEVTSVTFLLQFFFLPDLICGWNHNDFWWRSEHGCNLEYTYKGKSFYACLFFRNKKVDSVSWNSKLLYPLRVETMFVFLVFVLFRWGLQVVTGPMLSKRLHG